jgi:hypothetical protein
MAAKSKRVDPIKQREKRAKIAAIGGAVLFLGVAVFEVPSVMKMMNQKPPPGANATDAGNRSADGSIVLPSVAVNTGLAGNGQLADTDVPPSSADGQLVSFSMFETKNPFRPQVSSTPVQATAETPSPADVPPSAADKGGADVPASSLTPTTTTTTPTPVTTTPVTTTPVGTPATPTTTTTTAVATVPTVTLKVNGVTSHVAAQGTFPTGAPVFRLVSFTKDSAQIGIVGGSYASGSATLPLELGKPVTLENQTDGKRYTIELVATR